MDEDDFTPRLGRKRGGGKDQRYLSLVVKAARRGGLKSATRIRRFDGSRIGRGASLARVLRARDRLAGFRRRRVIVKMRPVLLAGRGLGGARAHLRYIQRDGATREGEAGSLYSADRDVADGASFLKRCEGDRHQFRFIVSAEDGDQYQDLKPFVRRLMRQMEADLGSRLEWVATDHFNTGHPHSHVILRGKNNRAENLVIAREYIAHGLRARAADIVTLDLGPRTDLEIERRLRADTQEERLTPIDRRLIRDMDELRLVSASDPDPFQQSLRIGRLQKLGRMDLAAHMDGDSWRLAPNLAETLRRIGERGDIIRTMQRELNALKLVRPAADRVIYDPLSSQAAPIIGRFILRGLADEAEDRHYLLIDGVDGRTHYAPIGSGEAGDPIPHGAIVRIAPRSSGVRQVDRTIAQVAAANGGRYSVEAHLRHDPAARASFAETHVRRLEALRRAMRSVERESDGSWIITPDHLAKVARFEARQRRDRPVHVDMLSAAPLKALETADAATWLDRELIADAPVPLRDAGFGREVSGALAARRQWLIDQQLAAEEGGVTVYQRGMLATLQRRELLRVAGQLSAELGVQVSEARAGEAVHGRLIRSVEMTSGRHALIERSRDFTLVPWRPVLDRHIGKMVSGVVRENGVNWILGRQRSGPSIT